MKKIIALMSLTAVTAALVGCQSMNEAGATRDGGNYTFSATAEAVSVRPTNEHDLAKARLAAAVNAKAALLEKIKGAKVSSKATVGDLLFTSQEAQSVTKGWLSRAEVTYAADAPDRLGDVANPGIVTATATLTLTRSELRQLAKFVD